VIRVLGMSLVMVGLGGLAMRVLRVLAQTSSSPVEELRQARLGLLKAAEQGHEIRNGLAAWPAPPGC
jgi:hypothetical protein